MRTVPLLLCCACTGTVAGPDKVAPDTADTSVIQETGDPDTDTSPVDTGWDLPSGEDLALINEDADTLELHFNTEQNLSPTADKTWTVPGSGGDILLCDFDGDGLDDAWALGESSSGDLTVKIYPNEGGTFSDTATFSDTFGFDAANFTYTCGDLGGSGRADLVAFKPDNTKLFVYPNTGGGFDQDNPVKTSTSFGANTRWLPADYDGDGDDELGALAGGTLKVYQATERAIVTSSPIITISVLDDYEVTVLDLDADDRADLCQYNGAAFLIWPGDGSTFDQASSWVFTISGTGTPRGANLR